jgi:nicotinate-nucleotide adenylyltransferase
VGEDALISRLRGHSGIRLGVMGGAFDPIHLAHLVTGQEALLQFGLDEVVFMVSGTPPHKKRRLAPAELRYLMTVLATASHPRFSVSRLEIDRPGMCYTVDTLETLAAALGPGSRIFFITGADAVLDILTWKEPSRLLDLCTLIAATRPGYDLSRLAAVLDRLGAGLVGPGAEARVEVMEIPALAISSSLIRERLAAGRPVRYLVPEAVAQFIEKNGLYAAGPAAAGRAEADAAGEERPGAGNCSAHE